MASTSSKLVLCIFIASCLTFTIAVSRPLSISKSTLAARLKLDEEELDEEEGSSACWDSLFKLQSCSGGVILFFLNGEAYLGPSCRAIRIIGHDCWPSMLGSLGFTSEESDILRGYCDASNFNVTSPPPTANATTNISHTSVPSLG